jgi:hypothetical protein
MPLVQRDDEVAEKSGEVRFWMTDPKTDANVLVILGRAAMDDFNKASGFNGSRMQAFKSPRNFFSALASAKYDRSGCDKDGRIVIEGADFLSFPDVTKVFDPFKRA